MGGAAAWSRPDSKSSGAEYQNSGATGGGGNSLAATGRPSTTGTGVTGITSRTPR